MSLLSLVGSLPNCTHTMALKGIHCSDVITEPMDYTLQDKNRESWWLESTPSAETHYCGIKTQHSLKSLGELEKKESWCPGLNPELLSQDLQGMGSVHHCFLKAPQSLVIGNPGWKPMLSLPPYAFLLLMCARSPLVSFILSNILSLSSWDREWIWKFCLQ